MDDSISRRVAIDAVKELTKWYYETFHETRPTADAVIDKLMMLPSAQPEPSTEIQEILNYLDTTLHPIVSPDNWYVYSELYDMVSSLSSAQPEIARRIVGKSRDGMTLWYQCDMCNEPIDKQDVYCRGCGRRFVDE